MLILIIWIISSMIATILFGINGFPFNLGNFILALIPGVNTLIVIKLLIDSLRGIKFNTNVFKNSIKFGANVFKNMKDTLNTIFKK